MRAKHIVKPIAEARIYASRFGKCDTHKDRDNEYYDKVKNKAYCTQCAIDIARSTGGKSLHPLEDAYKDAKE